MPFNIEIKAAVPNPDHLLTLCKNLKDCQYIEELHQHDTFYNTIVPGNRLKLRRVKNLNRYMLISYDRPDAAGDKLSDYQLTRLSDNATAENLDSTLRQSLGAKNDVKKIRTLFLYTDPESKITTRVHLDDVEDLGHFMELEIQLPDDQEKSKKHGDRICVFLKEKLEILDDNLISGAYADHLKK